MLEEHADCSKIRKEHSNPPHETCGGFDFVFLKLKKTDVWRILRDVGLKGTSFIDPPSLSGEGGPVDFLQS